MERLKIGKNFPVCVEKLNTSKTNFPGVERLKISKKESQFGEIKNLNETFPWCGEIEYLKKDFPCVERLNISRKLCRVWKD